MDSEIISKIKTKMAGELLPEQMKKLEEVLYEVILEDKSADTQTIREYLINYQKYIC